MKNEKIPAILVITVFLCALVSMAVAAQEKQDKYKLKALDGVAFSEFRGYEDWQDVAVSRTGTDVKAILANPVMIKAYREGIPGNGKPFPDGSMIVKIMWFKKTNPLSPYPVEVPDKLQTLAFIEKDSKRFPDTSGWGYAEFDYNAKSGTFTPYGKDASFGRSYCYEMCHTKVKATDYIFTRYPMR
ncbi:MAG: cytochrome P460 family protein [Candidatus Acidiferrales bacterium]